MTAPNIQYESVDWGARYTAGDTPWDLGGPHPEFVRRVEEHLRPPAPGRLAFVPGAGRGHDALLAAAAGWRVCAVDLAPELTAMAGPRLRAAGVDLWIGDALNIPADVLGAPVELFLEHTFLCALPLERRCEWGALARRLVARGGRLVALVFPLDKPHTEGGPPWGLTPTQFADLLGPDFELRVDDPVAEPTGQRVWKERFCVFERTAGAPAP